jgi:c-di-GMP-binding flagellar brake protein YcgR
MTIQGEKRRYTRIIFNEQNRVQAIVAFQDNQTSGQQLIVSVLNMSEGGMQISVERKKFQKIRQGDTVFLSSLKGIPDLESLGEIPMQVIWVMDNEYLEHVLLGMSFSRLYEEQRECLRFFVENRLALALKKGEKVKG